MAHHRVIGPPVASANEVQFMRTLVKLDFTKAIYPQIQAALGIPPSTTQSRLSRLRDRGFIGLNYGLTQLGKDAIRE